MGPPIEREVVRAMMLLRARSLAMGRSGARPVVAERILALLEAGITPFVPEHGSLGASGDLAPLAHCALVLTGEGDGARTDGVGAARSEALGLGRDRAARADRQGGAGADQRHRRDARDAGAGGVRTSRGLLRVADVAAAMSVEALLGTDRAFAEDLIALRPQPGQVDSAWNLRALLAGSEIVACHRVGDPRVQDAYSLRCAPQVIGAARDALAFARGVASVELRSAIDNPMVLPDGRVESCGNFHGAPVGMACDYLAIGGGRGGRDRRAADRPAARRRSLARAAAVPGRRTRASTRG